MVVSIDERSLRDCQAWEHESLKLSTTSNEAAKEFDACLTQLVGWFDDPERGGLQRSCMRMLEADPTFVLGQSFLWTLEVLSTGINSHVSPGLNDQVVQLYNTAKTSMDSKQLTQREFDHVNALKLWSDGFIPEAAEVYENILLSHPTDMLALKAATDTYFFLGDSAQIRDSVARVYPSWKEHSPLHGYLEGMLAFGFEETNMYPKAELYAKKALLRNKHDAWASHALAHVFEMEGRTDEGIYFMRSTKADWDCCNFLACHNCWHLALYHVEKGDFQDAIDIFNEEIDKRAATGTMLDIVDATSLLYRLQLEGVSIGAEQWESIYNVCRSHSSDHILAFNDVHFLFAYLGRGKPDVVDQLIDSGLEYASKELTHNAKVHSEVGSKVLEAVIRFSEGQYDDVVSLLYPIRSKIIQMGGSHAQRDLFSQLLIHSCILSRQPNKAKIAEHLLNERRIFKNNSSLTDRLMAKFLQHHNKV